VIDDDYLPGEGDVMPATWWRLPETFGLIKRVRSSRIPGHPLIAFVDEFTTTLSAAGPLYVSLYRYTVWDSTSSKDTVKRQIFESLTNTHPGMFSTVVGGPDVWLALRLTRLTDRIVTALLEQHERYQAHCRGSSA